jgi:hypothetical protein
VWRIFETLDGGCNMLVMLAGGPLADGADLTHVR